MFLPSSAEACFVSGTYGPAPVCIGHCLLPTLPACHLPANWAWIDAEAYPATGGRMTSVDGHFIASAVFCISCALLHISPIRHQNPSPARV